MPSATFFRQLPAPYRCRDQSDPTDCSEYIPISVGVPSRFYPANRRNRQVHCRSPPHWLGESLTECSEGAAAKRQTHCRGWVRLLLLR